MCERLGIHKTRTTPQRPQGDGLVERFHRTMGQQLAILTSQHQRDWENHLPLVLTACCRLRPFSCWEGSYVLRQS